MRRLVVFICLCFALNTNVVANPSTHPPKADSLRAGPQRIISLKPNITEILFALGVGENVVGVTTWCDWPVEAKKLPKVADYININSEKIIALKPDLVIGSEENAIKSQFAVLHDAGIKTLTVPFRTMDDLYGSIVKIAEEVNAKTAGEKIIKNIKSAICRGGALPPPDKIVGDHRGSPLRSTLTHNSELRTHNPSTVLILVGHRPLVAAGENTFYGDIIKMIGAHNIVDGKTPYPTLNTEFITAKDPDVIIDLAMGSEKGGDLPEILRKKVITFDMSEFRAGPRIGEAVKKLSMSFLPPIKTFEGKLRQESPAL